MINTFFGANLVDYHTIRIAIFSDVNKSTSSPFNLIIDGEKIIILEIAKQSFLNGLCLYECRSKNKIELGHEYVIQCRDFGFTSLNVNEATTFPSFDEDFYYDGDDLGATYKKDETTFKVWAPLASKVSLFIRKSPNDTFLTYKMKRGEKGVFSLTLNGDYNGYLYRYSVTNSGLNFITTDPYAKGSTANGRDSAVIDFSRVQVDLHEDKLPHHSRYSEAVIYEFHVRDMTIDDYTDIKHKGKYVGLTEEGRKTKGGNPAGLDYIKFLGVSHVQLLPIYDYKTVDELNPDLQYNWGYDPQQYFVPEGSYSLDPNDPYSRIVELKEMIAAFHKNGIKVNMDVVFNHVYASEFSTFEQIVPNYYFRKNRNGTLCNGSGCGNDLDTSRSMVRKLIIDALVFWMKEYGIDGYRFDLMGLIDIDTMNLAVKKLREIKPECMIYGEGWDMATNLPSDKKTSIFNAFKTPDIAFFNDTFRDIVRGNNDFKNNSYPGYILGNTSFLEGFKFVLLGSCVNYCYPPRFLSMEQSINYVECHDNGTVYDKITRTFPNKDDEFKLKILKMINATVLFSLGIPFYHAGQEIGLSKKMEDNTYNKGDEYNKFDYRILDERFEHSVFLSSLLHARKGYDSAFDGFKTSEDIAKSNVFVNLESGALEFKIFSKNADETYSYIFNPTDHSINFTYDDYYRLIIGEGGYLRNSDIYIQNVIVAPHSVNVYVKKKKNA